MQQHWNIRSRAHHCAVTNRPFEEKEKHHTAIYFDTSTGEFTRRDVCDEAWEQEISERKPFSHWRSVYEKTVSEAKPEITPKESAIVLLQRMIEEDHAYTEHARYILVLMLERKRILSPTAVKENDEGHRLLFYENKKTGDVYMVRDPELRLDELTSVQEEVATLLGFGGPNAEPAKPAKAAAPAEPAPPVPVEEAAPVAEEEAAPMAEDESPPESEEDSGEEELDEDDLDEEEEDELDEEYLEEEELEGEEDEEDLEEEMPPVIDEDTPPQTAS